MSTGAFEVSLNGMHINAAMPCVPRLDPQVLSFFLDQLIWSKLDSGRLPNLQEILSHIEHQQHFIAPQPDDEFSFLDNM